MLYNRNGNSQGFPQFDGFLWQQVRQPFLPQETPFQKPFGSYSILSQFLFLSRQFSRNLFAFAPQLL